MYFIHRIEQIKYLRQSISEGVYIRLTPMSTLELPRCISMFTKWINMCIWAGKQISY